MSLLVAPGATGSVLPAPLDDPVVNGEFELGVPTQIGQVLYGTPLDECIGIGHQIFYGSETWQAKLLGGEFGSPDLDGSDPAGAVDQIAADPLHEGQFFAGYDHCVFSDEEGTDVVWLNPAHMANRPAFHWSHDVEGPTDIGDFTGDADREVRIDNDPTASTHNLWQAWPSPHQAYSGNFETLGFRVEGDTLDNIPASASVKISFSTTPAENQHPYVLLYLECDMTFRGSELKARATQIDGTDDYQVRFDPTEAIFNARDPLCEETKEDWDAGDEEVRRGILGRLRIVQLSFWGFNRGTGPVVIDGVSLTGTSTAAEEIAAGNNNLAVALEHQEATIQGADHLLELQNEDGSFPILGHLPDNTPINVQGAIPHGLLETFKVTGDTRYLGDEDSGATGARNYIVELLEDDPSVTLTSSGVFYLAEYGLVTLNQDDLELAREHLARWTDGFDSAEEFVDWIVERRGNMGLWDTARWIRAAHDLGHDEYAVQMADALANQTIVDIYDETVNFNEYGLSAMLFGLAESDVLAHQNLTAEVRDELLSRQCENGAFPLTLSGSTSCDAAQSTGFAIMGLVFIGDVLSIEDACDFLVESQFDDGRWEYAGIEYVQTNADAITGLSMCTAPTRNGYTSYADAAVGLL